jgi:hypothetical protein
MLIMSRGVLACPMGGWNRGLGEQWGNIRSRLAFHEPGNCLCGCSVRLCLDVGVVGRHGLVGVTKCLAPDLRVDVRIPGQTCGAVPALMQLDDWQPCGLGDHLEASGDVVRSPRRTVVLAEDQVIVLPCRAGGVSYG